MSSNQVIDCGLWRIPLFSLWEAAKYKTHIFATSFRLIDCWLATTLSLTGSEIDETCTLLIAINHSLCLKMSMHFSQISPILLIIISIGDKWWMKTYFTLLINSPSNIFSLNDQINKMELRNQTNNLNECLFVISISIIF